MILAGAGGLLATTDVLLSTKSSGWKRFKREMRQARGE
jgi:hypothetical protein